jgi:hypothetical protein
LEEQYKQLRFLPEFMRYAEEHNFAHPMLTSKFVWEEVGRIINESSSWALQTYGANATWPQHNQTIMILVPTSCAKLESHISTMGEIVWPYINSTMDKLETAGRIKVLESVHLDEEADKTKKTADNLSGGSITGIAFGGIGTMATIVGLIFLVTRYMHATGTGASISSDSNRDETTANIGGNTTIINVNTRDDNDDDDPNNNALKGNHSTSAPYHHAYPDLTKKAYAGIGNNGTSNSVNMMQAPSVAGNMWSKFETKPVKNNLSR